jgi:urea carboxylase-associated protein 2
MAEDSILNETLQGGAMWSWTLKRGTALRLVAAEAGANVSALFLNADAPLERYNMPDTLKAQFIAFLTRGNVLYSDMGRVLCSITEDTCGWHDALCGATDARLTEAKYGATSYQRQRNAMYRNGRDNFLVELGKYGLGRRDLPAPVNFFSKVLVDEDGNLRYHEGHGKAGAGVELRAEMNVLVVLSNTPHPLDPSSRWSPSPIGIQIKKVPSPAADDPCRLSRPENVRGFQNTEILFR